MAHDAQRNIKELRDSAAVFVPMVKKGNIADARYVLDELDIPFKWKASASYREGKAVWGDTESRADDVAFTDTSFDPSQGKVPNVKGWGAKDAVYALESCGLNVRLSGKGKVSSQSIQPGSTIRKGNTIYLILK